MQENVTMQNRLASISAILCLATISYAALVLAQPSPQLPAGNAVPVTPDNFVRAETDMYFALFVKHR